MRVCPLFPALHLYQSDSLRQPPRGAGMRGLRHKPRHNAQANSEREAGSGNCPVRPHPQAWAPTPRRSLTVKFFLLMVTMHHLPPRVRTKKSLSRKVNECNRDITPATPWVRADICRALQSADVSSAVLL